MGNRRNELFGGRQAEYCLDFDTYFEDGKYYFNNPNGATPISDSAGGTKVTFPDGNPYWVTHLDGERIEYIDSTGQKHSQTLAEAKTQYTQFSVSGDTVKYNGKEYKVGETIPSSETNGLNRDIKIVGVDGKGNVQYKTTWGSGGTYHEDQYSSGHYAEGEDPHIFTSETVKPEAKGSGGSQTPPGGTQTPPGGNQTPPAGGNQTPPAGGGQTPPAGGTQQQAGDWYHSPQEEAYYDVKEGSTAYYGPVSEGQERPAEDQRREVYTVRTHENVQETTGSGTVGDIKYQYAYEDRPQEPGFGDIVHIDDGSEKGRTIHSQYSVGDVVQVDGKDYKVTGYTSANSDGSLNIELTPQGGDSTDPVVMNANDIAHDGKVTVRVAEAPVEIGTPYGKGDTISVDGKNYTGGTVYQKGDKVYDPNTGKTITIGEGSDQDGYYIAVTDEKGKTEYKSFAELDEKGATVSEQGSRKTVMGVNTQEAHRQDDLEARTKTDTISGIADKVTETRPGTVYKGKVGDDEVYIQYQEDGSKKVINAATGKVMSNVSDDQIDIYNITSDNGHGFIGDYEGRQGTEVKVAYSTSDDKSHINNQSQFMMGGKKYDVAEWDEASGKVKLSYTGADGQTHYEYTSIDELKNSPEVKVVTRNKPISDNQQIVDGTLYTTSNNMTEKLNAANSGNNKFIKDGVVYTCTGKDSQGNYVLLDSKTGKTTLVTPYELGNNTSFRVVTQADSEGTYTEGKTVEYKDGAYKVSGIIVDEGNEGMQRAGGTSQSYDRPEMRDDVMWDAHLTKKSGLPGIENATKNTPLKYNNKREAIDMLVASGQYTRKDATSYVNTKASEGLISYGSDNPKGLLKKDKYYPDYKAKHDTIRGAEFKNKANDLKDRVANLQTECSKMLSEMDGWEGMAKGSCTNVVSSIQGRIEDTMRNITQNLIPACEACEKLDELLEQLEKEDAKLEELIADRDAKEEAYNAAKTAYDAEPATKTETVTDETTGKTKTNSVPNPNKATLETAMNEAKQAWDDAIEAVETQQELEETLCDDIDALIELIASLEKNITSLESYVLPTGANHSKIASAQAIYDNYEDLIYDFTSYESFPALSSITDYKPGDIIMLDDSYGYIYKVLEVNPDGTLKIIRCDKNGNPIPGAQVLEINDAREIAPTTKNGGRDENGKITDWGGERDLYTPPTTVTQEPAKPSEEVTEQTTQTTTQTTHTPGPGPGPGPGPTTQTTQTTTQTQTAEPSTVTVTSPPVTITVTGPTATAIPTLIPTLPEPTAPTRVPTEEPIPVVPVPTIIPTGGGDVYVPHTGIEAGMGVQTTSHVEPGNAGALGALAGLLAGAAGVGMTAMSKDKEEEEKEKKESEEKADHKEDNKQEQGIPLTSENK